MISTKARSSDRWWNGSITRTTPGGCLRPDAMLNASRLRARSSSLLNVAFLLTVTEPSYFSRHRPVKWPQEPPPKTQQSHDSCLETPNEYQESGFRPVSGCRRHLTGHTVPVGKWPGDSGARRASAQARGDGELHREFRRVVRLRVLWLFGDYYCGGLFPEDRCRNGPARRLCHLCNFVYRAADRRHRLGPLWRQDRSSDGTFAIHLDHVGVDVRDCVLAGLRPSRHSRAPSSIGRPTR